MRFDGRVAIVTGAGSGLGAAHARLLARRGAAVLVNDLAASAEDVAAAIRETGGKAAACEASVEEGDRIVAAAIARFGRVDILVNNAGILRDRAFHNMTEGEWDAVYQVHLLGAFRVTRAAWPHLRAQRYGRVVMTTSGAALYGNFGQANYAAMKLALHGLALTLAREGAGRGIVVNTIAPSASSGLGDTMLASENRSFMSPDLVSPLVALLCHESCDSTGGLFEAGVGRVAALRFQRAQGVELGTRGHTPEDLAHRWHEITDFDHGDAPGSLDEAFAAFEKYLPRKLMPQRHAAG